MQSILCLVYFTHMLKITILELWYGKVNTCCHISESCSSFNTKYITD